MYEKFLNKKVKATYKDADDELYFTGIFETIENGMMFGIDLYGNMVAIREDHVIKISEVSKDGRKV